MKQKILVLSTTTILLFSQHATASSDTKIIQSPNFWYSSIHLGIADPPKEYNETNFNYTTWEFDAGPNFSISYGYQMEILRFEGEISYRQLEFKVWAPSTGLTRNGSGNQTQY